MALFDALVAVWFILKRYQPVALQISKHTLEQYHNKSNVTKIWKRNKIKYLLKFGDDVSIKDLISQVHSKGRFFQKVWCIFLIAQKICQKLSWKRDFEIVLCLESADSNCNAVSEGGKFKIQSLV